MAGQEYISSRRIGDATVTVICDGSLSALPMARWLNLSIDEVRSAMPEANDAGEIASDLNVVLVQLAGATILIDPGWGELDLDTESTRWYVGELRARRTPGVAGALRALGIDPDDVSHVLISHAHDDHFLGATVQRDGRRVIRYPRARHLIMRAEWVDNKAREDPTSGTALCLGEVERQGLLDLVDDGHEVIPGVSMLHTPGESPGHAIVRVQSGGETFYYLGDLFHHRCEIDHADWSLEWTDHAAMTASRQRFFAEPALERASVVFTHADFPAWGRITPTGTGHRWEAL